MPGSASLASLPAWPMDDRGLPGMTGDRQRGKERSAKNVQNEEEARVRAKERRRQKDRIASRILIK